LYSLLEKVIIFVILCHKEDMQFVCFITIIPEKEGCPIRTTCSSRENEDSTRASPTTRATMVTIALVQVVNVVYFSEIK